MRSGWKFPALLLSTVALAFAALGWAFGEQLFKPGSALAEDLANNRAGAQSESGPSLRLAQAVAQSAMKPESPEGAQHDKRPERASLTSYPRFEKACFDVAEGY